MKRRTDFLLFCALFSGVPQRAILSTMAILALPGAIIRGWIACTKAAIRETRNFIKDTEDTP
jgi:hypothetical protein